MKKILLFLLTFLACTYSVKAEDWLYLMGIDGWTNDASASYLFKYNNGTYTLLVEDGSKLSRKEFKLGNSEFGGKWFGYNDATVNLENTQDAYPDNGNMKFGTISEPVILTAYYYKWSDSEKKVSFALSKADDLYLRGEWDSYGTTQHFDRSGYVYTLTGVDASTIRGKKWQIASSEWKTKFGGSVTGVGTVDLTYGTNTAFASDFPDGTYDLTFDFSTLKLTVAAHSETPTYPTLYLRGFNSWEVGKCPEFANAEGTSEIYTLTIDYTTGNTIEWKIADSGYSYQYGASVAIAAAGEYTLVSDGSQKGFSSSLATGTYDLEYNYNTHVLKVTKQGTTPDPDPYPTSLYLYPGGKEIPAVAGKEGVYSVAGLTKSEIASFRFNTKSDNSGTAYGTTTGADVAITLGDNIDMKEGGGNCWTLTPEFDGTYDIEIDLSTMKFFVTQSTVTYPDVMYYYNGAKPCTVTLANIGDGVYSADIEVAAGESFCFYTDANATDDNTSYGPETAEEAVSLGSDITISHTSTNRWTIAEAGTYTFTVSLRHHRLNVVKKSETPTYTEYWLISEVIDSWKFNDKYQFHTDDGVTYTLKNIAVTAGKLFKISDKTHYLGYGDSDGQLAIADQATGYKIYSGRSALKWHTTITVNITYTRKSDTEGEIKVEYVYPTLWVRGGMTNNDWKPTEGYKMTCNDGVYTLENVTLSNTEFKIGSDETGNGVDWTYGFGANSTTDNMTVTADGQEYTIYDVNQGKNLKIGEVSGNVDITFTPNFTAKTGTLTIKLHDTPVVGYKVYVVRPVDAEEIPNIYCYGDFSNGSWPGAAMSRAENDLVLTEGERPIYVYTVTSACKVIVNTDPSKDVKGPWRYPADGAEGIQINKDTIIIFSGKSTATWEAFDPSKVSGINDVEIFDEAPVEFYNLQGVRVDGELTPGLYIRRQGGNASKILIR